MKSQPLNSKAAFPYKSTPVYSRNAPKPDSHIIGRHSLKQRGVVLFLTLIALLAMSLAAVALIRSVNTSSLIIGNLAFKQAATTSADAGIQAAMTNLAAKTLANKTLHPYIDKDAFHPLNLTNLAVISGYYSNFTPTPNITDPSWWNVPNGHVTLPGTDASGNTISYIIQRMCRTANVKKEDADCLLSIAAVNPNDAGITDGPGFCPPCGLNGQPAQVRVTVQTTGATGAVSYVQGFIY